MVAAAAAVLSFSSLAELAASTGYRSLVLGSLPVAWLLPVALDAAAGVATFVWLRASRAVVVVLARRIAWCAIGLSVVGNGVQHAYAAGGGRPHWVVAIAVGAVAPAVFGAVVHLAVVASSSGPGSSGPEAGGDQGWGPADTVTPPPAARAVRAVPSPAPARKRTATASSTGKSAGKAESSMAKLRRRAQAVEVPYNGRTGYRDLRLAVEAAEAAQAHEPAGAAA